MSVSSHNSQDHSLLSAHFLALHSSRPAQYFILNFSDEDFHNGFDNNSTKEDSDYENFGQKEPKPDQELDPGSWRPVLELNDSVVDPALTLYYSALKKMVSAASKGNVSLMEEAVTEVNASASAGDPPAQSVMGFVYGMGMTREANGTKSFQQHQLAAERGNMQLRLFTSQWQKEGHGILSLDGLLKLT
ncbi:hypothetical protein YC2023_023194 [Brassica napus]